MRQIKIDFLAPLAEHAPAAPRLQVGIWAFGLAFAAWEISFARQLLTENESLSAAAANAEVVSAANSRTAPPPAELARTSEAKPWFERNFLASAERAIHKTRQSGADLRLQSLGFDANRRMLIVRGDSARPQAIDVLAAELRAEFPQSSDGFPNVRNAADRAQFEIRLHFPAAGATR